LTHSHTHATHILQHRFHKCIFQQYNVDWVKKQSGWSFFGIVGSSSGSYDEKDLTSDMFRANSQTSCSLQVRVRVRV
jgi:hypothetical protein